MSSVLDSDSTKVLSDLLTLAENGDDQAERILFREYSSRLVRLASTRISSQFRTRIEAEDIVQSVFRSFFVRLRKGRLQFHNWNDIWSLLVCMTIRKLQNKKKGLLRRKRDINREVRQCDLAVDREHLTSLEPTPLEVAIFEETLAELLEPLDDLQRKVVWLRIQGHSVTQISEFVDLTRRSIYRTLRQIRNRIDMLMK